jgi:23S rRNA (cytosine1962-C5)-methyltransferase
VEHGAAATQQRNQLGPAPSEPIATVTVRGRSWSPLLYRKRLAHSDAARAGDLVAIYLPDQSLPAGYGLFNPRSELTVRQLWTGPELPSEAMWHARLSEAVRLRTEVLQIPRNSTAWRVVHAESDGLSGFVVDKFDDVLSAECFSLGMYQRASLLLPKLAELSGAKHWRCRTSPQFLSQEGCDPPELTSPGCPAQSVITEHGTRFRVRFEGGHKTGFFCDQRDNRRRLASFCEGRSVLDLCCYTGGFAVQAKVLGRADEVTGVDLDEDPLVVARENANLNQARARFVQADAFAYLRDLIRNGRQFDVVILDPPKLIRSRMELEEGTRRHFAMNRLAMRVVRPGGLLLSCSCAGLLPESEFMQLLIAASRSTGDDLVPATAAGTQAAPRTLQFLQKTGAAPDHPVISNCPETEYLKAAWMIVT